MTSSKRFALVLFIVLTSITISISYFYIHRKQTETIKVGILHSLTGYMAHTEQTVVRGAMMAIDELNQAGGLLGKKIEPILFDGQSDWDIFAQGAEQLITQEKVVVIFGCWTSASRKVVKPIVEKYNNLLFYPLQFEGLEQSPNIVYTGPIPNQQIIPGVIWSLRNLGKRLFLVGSDYIFPRAAHEIIKDLVAAYQEGTIVGEEYIPLESTDVSDVIAKIIAAKPDVIINTLNVDPCIPFFTHLRAAGISSEKVPTMSFCIEEVAMQYIDLSAMIGDYATWSYFQSVDRPTNKIFVEKFKKKYGHDAVISDPIVSAYTAVYLWHRAATFAQSTATDKVRDKIDEEAFSAPGSIILVDKETQNTWSMVRIGKILSTKQFGIVWESIDTVGPVPYPIFRTKEQWETFLEYWYKQWGEKWWKE